MSEPRLPHTPLALDVRSLDVHFGRRRQRRHIIDGVEFDIRQGEAVGLIGETGSGKSTIARAVLGLVRPSADSQIRVAGNDVGRLAPRALRAFRRSGLVQYVFQDPLRSLDPDLTAGQSIAEPLVIRGRLRRTEVDERVRQQLHRVQLDPDLAARFPAELSGGQRQRVAIARATITDPALLILDEPVSALDSANRVRILELLQSLRATDASLLFISHDLGSIAGITDRTLVLFRGRIVEAGSTGQIIRDPQHPYSRLLVGSAPTLSGRAFDRERRDELRREFLAS